MERVRSGIQGLRIGMNNQLQPQRGGLLISELDHFTELVSRIHVQERKRDRSWVKRLLR
jgi:hypothetical protein